MKLLLTTLTMIFISFGAFAKETLYSCVNDEWQFKVEDPIFGIRKLFYRRDGIWERTCSSEEVDTVNDTSFKCRGSTFIGYKYYILDEEFKTITFNVIDIRN